MHFSSTPCSIHNPSIALHECLIRSDYPVVSVQRVQTGVLIWAFPGAHLVSRPAAHVEYDQG